MNKPTNQDTGSYSTESSQATLPADQNRMCGTYLLRKGLNSMDEIQRARLFKTMKENGLLPFI